MSKLIDLTGQRFGRLLVLERAENDKDGDIVRGGPVGCGLHDDERHQDIAESCGCCPDFHCFRADEDNMVVKEIDDDENG